MKTYLMALAVVGMVLVVMPPAEAGVHPEANRGAPSGLNTISDSYKEFYTPDPYP